MYAWLYKDSPLVIYPLVALLTFVAVFVVVVLRTYGRGTRSTQEAVSQLPLFDDETRSPINPDTNGGVSHVQ